MNKITKGLFIGLILLTLTGCNNNKEKTITCTSKENNESTITLTYNDNKVLKAKIATNTEYEQNEFADNIFKELVNSFNEVKGVNAEFNHIDNNKSSFVIEITYDELDLDKLIEKDLIDGDKSYLNEKDKSIDDVLKDLEEEYICNK